jgi:hypothetical protein
MPLTAQIEQQPFHEYRYLIEVDVFFLDQDERRLSRTCRGWQVRRQNSSVLTSGLRSGRTAAATFYFARF